jgi:nicotinamidase-related amidase
MDGARSAGIPVVHVASGDYAHLYPQWLALRERIGPERSGFGDHNLVPSESREPGSVEGGEWWSEYYEEVFGQGYNEVWAAMTGDDACPRLDIAAAARPQPQDYVVTHGSQLNHVLRELRIWNLIYVGFATDLCLMDIPAAMKEMALRFNYRCILLRDCTATVEQPDTVDDERRKRLAVRQAEYTVGYSATSADFVAACERAADAG